jgi:transcriptional regulator with XRE-family HTH domain
MGSREATEFHFGTRVRTERERRGWSQQELAKRLTDKGIPLYASTIAKIESEKKPRAVRLGEAAGIADLFEVSLDSLVGRKPSADRDLDYALGALMDAVYTSRTELERSARSLRDRLEDIPAEFAGYETLAGHGREVFVHLNSAREVLGKLEDQLIAHRKPNTKAMGAWARHVAQRIEKDQKERKPTAKVPQDDEAQP